MEETQIEYWLLKMIRNHFVKSLTDKSFEFINNCSSSPFPYRVWEDKDGNIVTRRIELKGKGKRLIGKRVFLHDVTEKDGKGGMYFSFDLFTNAEIV